MCAESMTERPYLTGLEAMLPPPKTAASENTGPAEEQSPRVSIGLPVCNGEPYLRETLESLLAQTFTDFELVVSDNASTDQTEQICRKYTAKDKRIRYFRNETNLGAAENHNRVFRLSRGEYFKWAAADDVCAPEFLARCVAALDRDRDAVLAHTKVIRIDKQGKHLCTVAPIEEAASGDPCVRFSRLIQTDHGCELVYGVIRHTVLRHTSLIGKYCDSDRVLLSHLALFGHFTLIPEALFLNRTSSKSSDTFHQGLVGHGWTFWLAPSAEGGRVFPRWREFIEYCRVIAQFPLAWQKRLRCYMAMIVWLRHHWKVLVWDLLYYQIEWVVRHVPGAKTGWAWLKVHKIMPKEY